MAQQVFKGVRLPANLVRQIERIAKADGSTFSQFIRTAAIRELSLRKTAVA